LTERWEYKAILWVSSAELRNEGRHPSGALKRKWYYRSEFQIYEGDKELERRLNASTYSEDEDAETVKIQELLGEFGAEGWELVSENVLNSVIVDESEGWSQVGTPTTIRWMMKRRGAAQVEVQG
jgi:hypothetical protein